MKRTLVNLLTIFLLLHSLNAFSQTSFFTSQQKFTSDQLIKFYSSVTIDDDLVLFSANDYRLYAYSKSSGKQLWSSELGYKTKSGCLVTEEFIIAPYYSDNSERTALLDKKTGALIRLLPFGRLETKPIMKEGILYATAIYDGGAIFAYDVKKDTVLWWRFIAHGVSNQPYYFPGYIYANAEANNWVRISYTGQLLDTTCKEKADIFVQDIPCINVFNALTHDGFELDATFSQKLFGDGEAITPNNTVTGGHNTYILYEDKLVVLGKKKKILEQVDLPSLTGDTATVTGNELNQLLGADDQTVSFVYHDYLVSYDPAKHKMTRMTDLSAWEPAQVVLDKGNTWIISKKNGGLYGLSF